MGRRPIAKSVTVPLQFLVEILFFECSSSSVRFPFQNSDKNSYFTIESVSIVVVTKFVSSSFARSFLDERRCGRLMARGDGTIMRCVTSRCSNNITFITKN